MKAEYLEKLKGAIVLLFAASWIVGCSGELGMDYMKHGQDHDGADDTEVVAAAGGSLHSVGLRSDGTVWTWGANNNGQLGGGTTTNSTTPVQVVLNP
ncbi:MAG: hypothetical protein GXO94_07760 [Nitrospirae bacterium]|nr:hypothetical protein [Nitrospirota bacterium]